MLISDRRLSAIYREEWIRERAGLSYLFVVFVYSCLTFDPFEQIAIYPGPGRTGFKAIPRSKAVLYRTTDIGATFFSRGTGDAVL